VRLIGQIIFVALVLCALQGLIAVLVIAIILLLLAGLIFRTAETVGVILTLVLLAALQSHPWITIGAIAVLAAVLLIGRTQHGHAEVDAPPILLPPPEDRQG
jgi:hypothetical protein